MSKARKLVLETLKHEEKSDYWLVKECVKRFKTSESSIYKWLAGGGDIRLETFEKIADLLGIEIRPVEASRRKKLE